MYVVREITVNQLTGFTVALLLVFYCLDYDNISQCRDWICVQSEENKLELREKVISEKMIRADD